MTPTEQPSPQSLTPPPPPPPPPTTSWSWSRTALLAAGIAALGFGAQQLLTGGRATALGSSIPWLIAVLVVHDAVVAPATVAVGRVLRRLCGPPGTGWALPVVATALTTASVLAMIAVAVTSS